MELPTAAEVQAEEAQGYPAFRGFSLLRTREVLTELLAHIGKTPPFAEYTAHDISHIDALLHSLDWIIPADTKPEMSSADWLLIVLACYFHDLGMLVTREEFEARGASGFPAFRAEYLEHYDHDPERDGDTDAFLYQEFVRANHAERSRCWVKGAADHSLGVSAVAEDTIAELLQPLDQVFREDLGLVCLSHHLNDLGDLSKYPTSRPYGNSSHETANVQYGALLLRTVDLLHITRDRVPSIRYQLIAPRNPTSQREWAKQQAVRSVRPQPKRDAEGKILLQTQPDTIEVHAKFTDPEAFFALDNYITYARGQIRRSAQWAEAAQRLEKVAHHFPWRYIDSSGVEAEGFLPQEFRFVIEQANILDLLTGHTLYNESTVAIREVLQNSIDAVRLREMTGTVDTSPLGGSDVLVEWDSNNRTLTVSDAGTGMSRRQIEENFLKVGSSRYQEEEFRKQYPTFSPISRFGIGVLSTFMVADCVDVFTRYDGDEVVRHLKLRDVHGRYLIREIAPGHPDAPATLSTLGTIVKMRLREDVELTDPLAIARHWIIAPAVQISFVETNGKGHTETIGNASVAEALRALLSAHGVAATMGLVGPKSNGQVAIVTKGAGSTEVAVALSWNAYFRTWEFYTAPMADRRGSEISGFYDGLATCVEGIRVESGSPGYTRDHAGTNRPQPVAFCNATGPSAPKTDVARSGLERGGGASTLFRDVYTALCSVLHDEFTRLLQEEKFSLTRAVGEIAIQSDILLESGPSDRMSVRQTAATLPLFVIEDGNERRAISLVELESFVSAEGSSGYFTIASGIVRTLESLIRVGSIPLGLGQVAERLDIPLDLPPGIVLSGASYGSMESLRTSRHEPIYISASPIDGRVSIKWSQTQRSSLRWLSDFQLEYHVRESGAFRVSQEVLLGTDRFFSAREVDLLIVVGDDVVSDLPEEVIGVQVGGTVYLCEHLGAQEIWKAAAEALAEGRHGDGAVLDGLVAANAVTLLARRVVDADAVRSVKDELARRYPGCGEKSLSYVDAIASAVADKDIVDPANWVRGGRRGAF